MNDLTVWILTGALSAAVTALIALLITRGALNRLRGERDQARDRLATLAEERDRQHQQQCLSNQDCDLQKPGPGARRQSPSG